MKWHDSDLQCHLTDELSGFVVTHAEYEALQEEFVVGQLVSIDDEAHDWNGSSGTVTSVEGDVITIELVDGSSTIATREQVTGTHGDGDMEQRAFDSDWYDSF